MKQTSLFGEPQGPPDAPEHHRCQYAGRFVEVKTATLCACGANLAVLHQRQEAIPGRHRPLCCRACGRWRQWVNDEDAAQLSGGAHL